jgi:site-specific recombinase XerD
MVTNENYRNFLDNGMIEIITKAQFQQALENISERNRSHIKEGRSLLITLYYTGCRPVEALKLQAKHFEKEGEFLKIKLAGAKKGLPRVIYLPYRIKEIKELEKYSSSFFEDYYLFIHYKNHYIRNYKSTKGRPLVKTETSDKLRYYIKKWFEGVIPNNITTYFLRHNRFSELAIAGLTPQDIKFLKGARSVESVSPYLHLSSHHAKKIAKKFK